MLYTEDERVSTMENTIRLSGIIYESLVNGPGMRRVFFAQGCKHNCQGCFNPDTHDFNGGQDKNMDELILDTIENPMIKGVTFSGGDPLEQAEEFAYMAKIFKEHGLDIWSYTGYTYEFILENQYNNPGWSEFINNIDVLVDGKFEKDRAIGGLKFRGSSNQRIIDVKNSLISNEVVVLDLNTKE